MEEIRCSMCGKPNPTGTTICQYCGARLTPIRPANAAGKFTGGLSWLDAFRDETGGKEEAEPKQKQSGGQEESSPWGGGVNEEPEQEEESIQEEIPHWTAALRTWADPSSDNADEGSQEEETEESEFPDNQPKVTDWFSRIMPGQEKESRPTYMPTRQEAEEKDEYIDDSSGKAIMDDFVEEDWRDKSASLSSIRDSSTAAADVPPWLQNDAGPGAQDSSESLLQWLQDLDEKEGGKGKNKARYWMGEIDTDELPKERVMDPRFVDNSDSKVPIYDPFAEEKEKIPGRKSATQFFDEDELDGQDSSTGKHTPTQTVYFNEQGDAEEEPAEEEVPPWILTSKSAIPRKPAMTAALDADDASIPDWMKDQPVDETPNKSGVTASNGLGDADLGMDLPADEVPPWMAAARKSDVPIGKPPTPILTAILSDEEDESTPLAEEKIKERPSLRPSTPILTAALSGLDDEDLGMDLPVEEVPPWIKSLQQETVQSATTLPEPEETGDEEETPPWVIQDTPAAKPRTPSMTARLTGFEDEAGSELKKESAPWLDQLQHEIPPEKPKSPSLMTATLKGLDDEAADKNKETPLWAANVDEVKPPDKAKSPTMTAAFRDLDEEDLSEAKEAIPAWMQDIEEVTPPAKPKSSLMTAALKDLDDIDSAVEKESEPDWLKDLGETVPSEPLQTPILTAALTGLDDEIIAASADDDVPDWIKDLQPAGFQPLTTTPADEINLVNPKEKAPGTIEKATPAESIADSEQITQPARRKRNEDATPETEQAFLENMYDPFATREKESEKRLFVTDALNKVPDWLADLGDETGTDSSIMEKQTASTDRTAEATEEEDDPFAVEEQKPDQRLYVTAALNEIPDWLANMGDEGAPDLPVAAEPSLTKPKGGVEEYDPFAFEEEEEPGQQLQVTAALNDVPDWLANMGDDAIPEQPAAAEPSLTKPKGGVEEYDPFAFKEEEAPDQRLQVTAALNDVPDWLANMGDDAIPEQPAAAEPSLTKPKGGVEEYDPFAFEEEEESGQQLQVTAALNDVPDWLANMGDDAIPEQPAAAETALSKPKGGVEEYDPFAFKEEEAPDQRLQVTAALNDVPDWLANMGDDAMPEQPAAAETALSKAKGSVEEYNPFALEEEEESDPHLHVTAALNEVPDWLANMGGVETPDLPAATETSLTKPKGTSEEYNPFALDEDEEGTDPRLHVTAALNEVPDWLANIGGEDTPESIRSTASATEEPFTEFISTGKKSAAPFAGMEDEPGEVNDPFTLEEQAPGQRLYVTAALNGVPDWLANMGDDAIPAQAATDEEEEDLTPRALPDVSRSPAFPAAAKAEKEKEIPLENGEMPAWLTEIKPQGKAEQPTVAKPAFTFAAEDETIAKMDMSHPFAGDDLPNWLSPDVWQADGKQSEETPKEPGSAGVGNIQWELEGLEKGEMPSWLAQIKPGQSAKRKRVLAAVSEEGSQTEKVGPLAGLMGVLPARDMVMMYRKPPVYSDQLHLNERQSNRIQVLSRMIESEAKNQPLKAEQEKIPLNLIRVLFAVLLILVMIIPFSGILPIPGSLPLNAGDPVIAFYNQVEQYPEQSSVLLVMDFESGYTAEMRSALDGLVERLYEKNVNIAMISTLPTGPVLAEEIAQSIWLSYFSAHPEINGTDYQNRVINLGYLPGGSAAMMQFVNYPRQSVHYSFRDTTPTSVWDSQALAAIQSSNDFAGVIVVTDSQAISRNWIEQSTLRSLNNLLFITSAQTYSMILPYWQTGQVKGLIAGIYQGYSYRTLLNQSDGLVAKWFSYQFGMNLVTLVAVLLTIIFIIRNTFRGGKTQR
jgi:hypothetical protein